MVFYERKLCTYNKELMDVETKKEIAMA